MRLRQLTVLLTALASPAWALAQPEITRTVFPTGGGTATSPTMSLSYTIGEPVVGRIQSTTMEIRAGFWRPPASAGVPCYPDCELDGDLDIFDFLCFQNAYGQQLPYADCEQDGDWDVFDFLCFQGSYGLGCS